MRFLADESCDFAVVRALRAAGHDVVAITEISPRATDEGVMELAIREGRILLTEDKDFGQLVHANQAAAGGVFLLRFPARARADLPGARCQAYVPTWLECEPRTGREDTRATGKH